MSGSLYILRIEVDGHWGGSPDVPRPWVARIVGSDPKYGLRREFIDRMNDWQDARRAWSGNLYGVVATFPLRDGSLYEVCRARGRASRRYMAREFRWCEGGKLHPREPADVLARVDGGDGEVSFISLPDELEAVVSEVAGLGAQRRLAWVVVDGRRLYRLLAGRVYSLPGDELVTVADGRRARLAQGEAWALLRGTADQRSA